MRYASLRDCRPKNHLLRRGRPHLPHVAIGLLTAAAVSGVVIALPSSGGGGPSLLTGLSACLLSAFLGAAAARAALRRAATRPADGRAQDGAAAREADLEQRLGQLAEAEAARRVQQMNDMAEAIETELIGSLDALSAHAQQMQTISDAIAAGAARSGENAVMSSEAADLSVDSANRLAHITEDLNTAIQRISQQVNHATDIAAAAVAASDDAKRVIGTLTGQAASIQSVVDLIRTIAGQTNLLALNATIEAARAGEAGRGFAVVAGEVKGLARKTAHSTASIAETIASIRAANAEATGAMDRIGEAVGAMEQVAAAIAAAVNEQRAVTEQIAASVRDTVTAARGLSERISRITEEVGTSFETAAEVHTTAGTIAASTTALLADFRSVVVRAVRTSAPEVNRRDSPRRALDAACVLDLDGAGRFDGRVRDVSETGARLLVPAEGHAIDAGPRADASGLLTADSLRLRRPVRTVGVAAMADGWTVRMRFADVDGGDASVVADGAANEAA